MEIITENSRETKELAGKLANKLIKSRKRLVFGLVGELGSGKTTFVQGLAEALGVKARVVSPTFILTRRYPLAYHFFEHLYHIDLYRLEKGIGEEIKNLGLNEILSNPKNVVAIEWAEKMKEFLPEDIIWIKFSNLGKNMRKISH